MLEMEPRRLPEALSDVDHRRHRDDLLAAAARNAQREDVATVLRSLPNPPKTD
ncbi:MAG TPA: hypothetical protein VE547_08750 [Mycobacteriales bacterium]|nr:hypothetical protein [Mycobacteriales bacterium]